MGCATSLVKSQKYMGKNPITKDHQPNQPLSRVLGINLKPDLVWYKMEYQKFLDNPNNNKYIKVL